MTPFHKPQKKDHPYAAHILAFKRILTYALMTGEQFTNALWRIFFWLLLFCGLWLMEIPDLFALKGYYAASILFIAGILYFLWKDLLSFSLPSLADVDRRIEQDSRLKHRPLSEMQDRPVSVRGPDTMRLWELEQNRRQKELSHAQPGRWRSFLSAKDRHGLRLMAVIIFIAGFMMAGADWQGRLIQGLFPLDWKGNYSEVPPMVATITPPEYTKKAQVVLQGGGDIKNKIDIPSGSTIKVIMQDSFASPYILDGTQKLALNPIENGGYEAQWTLDAADNAEPQERRLDVKQFFISRFGFDYTLIPDTPPRIALQEKEPDAEDENKETAPNQELDAQKNALENEPDNIEDNATDKEMAETSLQKEPLVLPDAQIQIPLNLYDDYGVKTITMHMRLDDIVEEAPLGYEVRQTRSVMSPPDQEFQLAPTFDFTDNPWAGLPVTIDITATDHLGQTAKLDTISMPLPEREFKHPMAQKLIALRKQLAWEPRNAAISVHDGLVEILEYPQDFQDDEIVYLSLSTAASRLKHSVIRKNGGDIKDVKSVMDLLWNTALRIEDGNLSIAARNLRQAQMELENALQNPDMTNEQIASLMNELRLAMGDYLTEFKKELQKRFAQGEELLLTPEMLDELLDPESLAGFLSQMENEMLEGNTDTAQGMLSQLQRMLDMLNPNMALPMPENMMAMMDGVSELQQLIDKQEELLVQTEEQKELQDRFITDSHFGELLPPNMDLFMQWGLDDLPPPPSAEARPRNVPGIDFDLHQTEQEALRFVLGQLMLDTNQALGDIPEEMGLAEREMYYSAFDLGDEKPDLSIPHQEQAIEYLKQAQQSMQNQMEQMMEQMAGAMDQNGDPFGQQFGQRFSQRGQGGMRYDPLGRPIPGGEGGEEGLLPDSNVKIPDEAQRKRVEEILRTLRERSGELYRPREELEYFRRLLRQF